MTLELPPWHGAPIHHVALQVIDLPRAEAFYHGALALPVVTRHADAQGQLRSVWLDLGHGTILMLEKASTPHHVGAGWHLVALTIEPGARTAVEAALAKRQVPITGRTDYSLYVEDPEGNRVAFSHYPHKP